LPRFQIHIGWISCQVASLQLLSRLKVHGVLQNRKHVEELPLPCRLQNLIGMLFTQTIRVRSRFFLKKVAGPALGSEP
jgi:hypothetical protein